MYMPILSLGAPELLIVASVMLVAAAVWWIDKLRKKGASRGQNQ
jgi:hypothetical protein